MDHGGGKSPLPLLLPNLSPFLPPARLGRLFILPGLCCIFLQAGRRHWCSVRLKKSVKKQVAPITIGVSLLPLLILPVLILQWPIRAQYLLIQIRCQQC